MLGGNCEYTYSNTLYSYLVVNVENIYHYFIMLIVFENTLTTLIKKRI